MAEALGMRSLPFILPPSTPCLLAPPPPPCLLPPPPHSDTVAPGCDRREGRPAQVRDHHLHQRRARGRHGCRCICRDVGGQGAREGGCLGGRDRGLTLCRWGEGCGGEGRRRLGALEGGVLPSPPSFLPRNHTPLLPVPPQDHIPPLKHWRSVSSLPHLPSFLRTTHLSSPLFSPPLSPPSGPHPAPEAGRQPQQL